MTPHLDLLKPPLILQHDAIMPADRRTIAAWTLQRDDLPRLDRRLLNLHFGRAMNDREVAQRIGLTVEEVRARLSAMANAPIQFELIPSPAFQQTPANLSIEACLQA